MKLSFKDIKITKSAAFTSANFDIGDKRIIMEILRGKMYSNPIYTICQEISSNARDAHREVGKDKEPIEIKMPNKLDPVFWIKDFGPGITPDRIANIFVKYGCSTKREDNIATGGFGLGGKSPFSYSDSFTVVSITPNEDQDGNPMMRREYIAYIDESGLGQMTLVKEEETSELQGTTIIIAPKEADFETFKTSTKQVCCYWDVRPTIKGDPEWEWPKYEVKFQGKDWSICEPVVANTRNSRYNYGYYNYNNYNRRSNIHTGALQTKPLALIDGIPYNLNLGTIFPTNLRQSGIQTSAGILNYDVVTHLQNTPIRLNFEVGELSVTANREEIDYQPNVIDQVRLRIKLALNELAETMMEKLNSCTNLWDAVILWKSVKKQQYGNLLKATEWDKIPLNTFGNRLTLDKNLGIGVIVYDRDDNMVTKCRKQSSYRNRNASFYIEPGTMLVINDIKKKTTSRQRITTLLDQNSTVNTVVVVDFFKKETVDKDGKTQIEIADDATIASRMSKANIKYHWDKLAAKKLSSFAKTKAPKAAVAKKKPVKIRKLSMTTYGSIDWSPTTIDDVDKAGAPIKQRVYLEKSGTTIFVEKTKTSRQTMGATDLRNLLKVTFSTFGKFDIYGVIPTRVVSLPKHWVPLRKFLLDAIEKERASLSAPEDLQWIGNKKLGYRQWPILSNTKITSKIDKDSIYYQYVEKSKQVQKVADRLASINSILRMLKQDQLDTSSKSNLEKIYRKFTKRYPMVYCLSQSHGNLETILDEIVSYVNMKDKGN